MIVPYLTRDSISGMYFIKKADFSKVRVTVKNQIYTGDEIKPGKDSITVKIGYSILSDDDYDIVAYGPNLINKGKNTITLKGVGNYGGTVTVKYTIGSKRFLWWSR